MLQITSPPMTDQPTSLRLMNFRIPSDLKSLFQGTCRRNRTRMSSELNRLVSQYVRQDILDQRVYQPAVVETHPAASVREITYRDPDTGLVVTRKERHNHANR